MEKLKFDKSAFHSLSSIYGGGGNWKTSKETVGTNSEGCTVRTTETWDDKDNDGRVDKNESVAACISVDCPN
jgi:hypothetical protein